MISKFSILAIAALYFLAPSINGQDCIPTQVMYISIAANSVLFWEVNPKEPCPIDQYIVDIVGDQNDEYHFTVSETFVDVSFLQVCELWNFVVRPVADGVVGYERRLVDHVPLPPTADLSLSYFNVTHLAPRELLLEWDLMNHTHGDCTLRYRVVIEDEDNGIMHDVYVTGTSTVIDTLSPCVNYEFSVRAINRAHPTIEGPLRYRAHAMPAHALMAPTLRDIEVGATTVDLSLDLESLDSNRCPIRTLYVDAGNNFNISVALQNSDFERPPVEVNLKGLQPDSMYFLKLSVENSGGISQAAQIGVQTLPLDPGRK